VPFNDLSRIPESIKREITSRVGEVINSGSYILGPEVEKFETELSNYLGCNGAVGVATGTDALILALLASGVGPGDSVLTMANAGSYTTVAARAIGAEPIFVDVSADSLQMTLSTLQDAYGKSISIEEGPKALVVTHLFGQISSDIELIVEFARGKGLVLIEDCAQAIGARHGSKLAGTFGALSTFSFFPTKNLGALGDGGAVAGNNPELLSKVKQLRQYGWKSKYSIELPFGRNSRLDEIQATILRVKLPRVPEWNQRRREIFSRYLAASGTKIKFYSEADDSFVGHLCPITVSNFSQSELLEYFASKSVSASVHFPVPDNKQRIDLKYRDLVMLPNTENACAQLVTIPIFPEMTELEVDIVCKALAEIGN
jgi:dTDP-4-amino-4,6-dideoxygalactose transaminase